jgi:hypothetical protein
MAYDTTLISNTMDWFLTTLAGIASPIEAEDVTIFKGSIDWTKPWQEQVQEILEEARRPFMMVAWMGSSPFPTTEGNQDRGSTYRILIVTENPRGSGAEFVGESAAAADVGMSWFLEQVIAATHNKRPNAQSAILSLTTDDTQVQGSRQIFGPRSFSICEVDVFVKEVPTVS